MKRLPLNEAEKQKKLALLKRLKKQCIISTALTLLLGIFMKVSVYAAGVTIDVTPGENAGNVGALEVIFLFAFLALLPSIILMMTSFTRIIIVLSFLRNALGTNQSPPNIVLTGLAFFLSLFIMMPVINEMNDVAYKPFKNGTMTSTQAMTAAAKPLKKFMLKNTTNDSLKNFVQIAKLEVPEVADANNPVELLELPLTVIAPAFIISELSRAFMMGFLIFLPFMIIDLVVSSILMSMGMIMLPPAMISLPFKILLFVLVDGWNLMTGTLVNSFTM